MVLPWMASASAIRLSTSSGVLLQTSASAMAPPTSPLRPPAIPALIFPPMDRTVSLAPAPMARSGESTSVYARWELSSTSLSPLPNAPNALEKSECFLNQLL